LPEGSPAINTGENTTCLVTDQRGEARLNNASNPCDIGAFESIFLPEEDDDSFYIIPLPNGKSVIFGL